MYLGQIKPVWVWDICIEYSLAGKDIWEQIWEQTYKSTSFYLELLF